MRFENLDIKELTHNLRNFTKEVIENNKNMIILNYFYFGDKCYLSLGVSDDITYKYKSNDILSELIKPLGGKGGGKKDISSGIISEISKINKR